jgi:hypothetical protein
MSTSYANERRIIADLRSYCAEDTTSDIPRSCKTVRPSSAIAALIGGSARSAALAAAISAHPAEPWFDWHLALLTITAP